MSEQEGFTFPRTMTKGLLKGRRFDTKTDYLAALAEAKGKRKQNGEHRFELTVVDGGMTIEITGDPRSPQDIDRLLDLLSKFGGQ